jgi:hypothetical protein
MIRLFDAKAFHDDPVRYRSPEWDFGVMWIDTGAVYRWPLWRVSWIVETGELYAQTGNRIKLLGIVPPVGEYPYPSADPSARNRMDAWTAFKDAQTIERIMEGWAEGEPHKPLQWIMDRLRQVSVWG